MGTGNFSARAMSRTMQYGNPLDKGLVDPSTALPEYVTQLKDAGMDKIVAEGQKQVDAWAKALPA